MRTVSTNEWRWAFLSTNMIDPKVICFTLKGMQIYCQESTQLLHKNWSLSSEPRDITLKASGSTMSSRRSCEGLSPSGTQFPHLSTSIQSKSTSIY